MTGITTSNGKSFADTSQLQQQNLENGTLARLIDGRRYAVLSVDNGAGIPLASGNFANPYSSEVKSFNTIAKAINDTRIIPESGSVSGDLIQVKENKTGTGGAGLWKAVLSTSVTENPYNIRQCVGVPSASLVLITNNEIDITQIGAVSGDDSFDNTAIIQHAIDLDIPVLVPVGIFAATSISPRTGMRLSGAGRDKSILKQVLLTAPSGQFSIFEPADTYSDIEVSHIGLDGNFTVNDAGGKYANQTGDGAINGWRMANMDNARLHNMDIKDFLTDGVYWAKISGANNVVPTNCSIDRMRIKARRNGVVVTQADGFSITNCLIYDVTDVSPFSAIDIEPFEDTTMKNGLIDNIIIQNCTKGIGMATKGPAALLNTFGENIICTNIIANLAGPAGISVHGINNVQLANIILTHPASVGATVDSSMIISQSKSSKVNNVTSVNADFAGVRVLDAFVGDLNDVDTDVQLSDITVINPRRHGIAIGNETGSINNNKITAQLNTCDVTSGVNTDGTGHGFLLGDINANFVSMTACRETSTDFENSLYFFFDSSVFLSVTSCDFEKVFATDDAIGTSQPVFEHMTLAASTFRALTGTNNPSFGGRVSVFNSGGSEAIRLDGDTDSIRFLSKTLNASVGNNSFYVSSADNKLKWRNNSGTEISLEP